MKRYILEIDREQIWSYEADDAGAKIKCTLMKSHGEDAYWLEDGYDSYWKWFQGEISQLAETAIDICFLYEAAAKEKYEGLSACMPKFNKPVVTNWRLSELQTFFREFRKNNRTSLMEYQGTSAQFRLSDGQMLFISGLGSFQLLDDIPKNTQKPEAKSIPQQDLTAQENDVNLAPRKAKVKVYGPPSTVTAPAKGKKEDTIPKRKEPVAIRSNIEKMPKKQETFIAREPAEKVGADDLQRFFQQKTEGQCDTVLFQPES